MEAIMTSNPRETGAKRLGLGLSNDRNNIRSQHVVPADLPVSRISCKETWSKLSEPQKHSRASWSGSRICCSQVSEVMTFTRSTFLFCLLPDVLRRRFQLRPKESPDILRMLLLMFSSTDILDLKRRCHHAAVTPSEWDSFTAYAACFLANKGNYLAFGDMKFIPGIPANQLDIIVRICPLKESPDILKMLLLMFSSTDILDLKRRCHLEAVTPWEWDSFTAYAACFLANKGNYLAFGDMKFIPGIPDNQLDIIVRICPLKVMSNQCSDIDSLYGPSMTSGVVPTVQTRVRVILSVFLADDKKRRVLDLWDKRRKKIYSLSSVERRLGMPPHGLSAYYSNNMSPRDVQLVSDWMMDSEREPWNTRVWKTSGHGDLPEYELRIASARSLPTKTYSYKNKGVIHVIYGDHKEDLKDVVINLRNAIPYADTDHQREMLKCFIDYLETGSIESHKRSQILWLQQGEPAIEVNIGFVETYRDPQRCRAEFEGYVAVRNQSASKQFRPLRERAKYLLAALPWPKEFHAEEAQSTDFACFQIFAFANGSIPAGVNLPNYEDVRVAHGSRNLCFLDVLGSKDNNFQTTFLDEDDARIVQRLRHEESVVQVAFHELLGHGSGKLFIRNSEGGYNFPYGKVRHPITGELVSTCYKPGETWNSVFGDISSAFEECRAECVGLFFTTHPEAMEAVGYKGQQAEDLMYVNWLMMVRAGFMAIAVYSEDTDVWPQAHAQARFAILCTLLAASELDAQENAGEDEQHERKRDFIKIHGCEYRKVIVRMNRNKIKTVGFPALRTLLMRLQVYRSTADVTGGREFFKLLTTVPKSLLEFKLKISRNRRSGPLFVQAHTSVTTNKEGESRVLLEEFSPTPVGIIESSLARFRDWISGG